MLTRSSALALLYAQGCLQAILTGDILAGQDPSALVCPSQKWVTGDGNVHVAISAGYRFTEGLKSNWRSNVMRPFSLPPTAVKKWIWLLFLSHTSCTQQALPVPGISAGLSVVFSSESLPAHTLPNPSPSLRATESWPASLCSLDHCSLSTMFLCLSAFLHILPRQKWFLSFPC